MAQDQKQGIYITQEDIDTALAAAPRPEKMSDTDGAKPLFLDEADIVDSGPGGDSEEADYFGLLSQDDIEALLHGDLDVSSGQEAQDEIDNLIQTPTSTEDISGATEKAVLSDKKNATQEDVERLMQDAKDEVDASVERVEVEASEEDAAVSQDDIDRLLVGALDDSGDEDVAGRDLPETDSQEAGEALSQNDLDRLVADASEDDGQDVEPEFMNDAESVAPPAESLDDAESVEPEMVSESLDGAESLISQTDLDQLLGNGRVDDGVEAPSSESESKSEHISQDDINRLLKESIEEAEDLLDEEVEISEESESQEPVILAADETPPEPTVIEPKSAESKPEPSEKTRKIRGVGGRRKRIWENRIVWAAAAGIVLFVSITAMMMSSGPTEMAPQPKVMTFSLSRAGDGVLDVPVLSSTRIRLPGFVVLAPPNSAAVTYVAADLTLDFSDAAVVSVIKENEAFVRDIIYGTISSELMTRDISAIDEISVELAIRKALGRVVARDAIDRIAFDRFSMV